jgi:aspartokinase/homoserine dehydrogenase 1
MKGVTDTLIQAASAAEAGNQEYRNAFFSLTHKHHETAKSLIGDNTIGVNLLSDLDAVLGELGEILHGVELVRECSSRTGDLISGFGERLSCLLVAAHLNSIGLNAAAVDARDIIRTDDNHGRAAVNFPETNMLIRGRLSDRSVLHVVTGFIASTAEGVATTLGRNGSDYTATIIGAALDEDSVEIWTDVDGVLTADPRVVPEAWVLDEISFQEAMELSYFGAEVIHPYTLVPVMEKDLPVYIKNTMNPTAPGTKITRNAAPKQRAVTGIASIDDVSMVTIEGGGMVGMPGVAGRIFSSVARSGSNIIMITQASSEHSICLVFRSGDAAAAVKGLRKDLADAISSRMIKDINLIDGLEIVAVIGENMRGRVGLSGRLFGALGNAGVNILAIAQGSTELNISLVVAKSDKSTAINAIHQAFIG